MTSPIVNQGRQRDDLFFQQSLLVPPGGTQFMLLNFVGPVCERETEGFAAIAGSFIGSAPFSVVLHQSPSPGLLLPQLLKASSPDPVTGIDRCDLTKSITGKYIAVSVIDTSGVGCFVVADARLRPVSCYDMEVDVVFDPGDLLNIRHKLGSTVAFYNGNSGGVSTPMFGATANRLEVVGVNIGPRPIHVTFGPGAAVFGAGQYIRAGGDFRFDWTGLAISFIDDGQAGGALVSATQFSLP